MNKYIKSSFIGTASGITSYLIWGKSKKTGMVGAIIGFLVALWVIKEFNKQKKILTRRIVKDIDSKSIELQEAGINPIIELSNKSDENNKLDYIGIQDINLYDTSLPLTKRIFGLLLNHCDDPNNKNSWKRSSIDGVVDLYQQEIDGHLVRTYAINHENEDNFIHVFDNPRKGYHFVTLYIKVPAYVARGNYATPKLKDYKNRLKEYIEEFWKSENINSRKPSVFQKGIKSMISKPGEDFLKVNDDTHYVPVEKFVEISDEEMDNYATIIGNGEKLPDGLSKMVSFFDDSSNLENAEYESVSQFAVVEIEVHDGTKSGIELPQFIKFLRGLVDWNKFVVTQANGDAETLIGPYVFHPGSNFGEIYGTDLSIQYSYFADKVYELKS